MRRFKNYIFDLDATLYQDNGEVEAGCERLIDKFFMTRLNLPEAAAHEKRREILHKFRYEAEAMEPQFGISVKEFMDYICDVDVSHLPRNPFLEKQLRRLPGRCFIFTDSTAKHARDTLCQIGVNPDVFTEIFDAEKAGYKFKYQAEAFECFFEKCRVNPGESVMFEDSLRNLKTARSFGMTAILISGEAAGENVADAQFSDINKALEVYTEE